MKLFILTFMFLSVSTAQVYRLHSALNVRSDDSDFISTDDVIGHVSPETEFEIISSQKLRTGAKAIQIKITKLGPGSNLENYANKSLYIYQNKKTEFKSISNSQITEAGLTCPDGECLQSPAQQQMNAQPVVQTAKIIAAAVEEQNSVPVQTMDEKIKRYENSVEVQKTIRWAYDANKNRTGGVGACYRRVKEALATKCDFKAASKLACTNILKPEGGKAGPGNNLIPKRHDDNRAANAVNTLPEFGFINLLDQEGYKDLTPETAPKGAVLVYQSRIACNRSVLKNFENGCGHTEIKLGDGNATKGFKFASDYVNDISITAGATGKMYKLVGVMIKPDL